MTLMPTDLRLAARQLVRHPASTAALVLTLASGIAVGSLSFALVNAAFLRPPAVVGYDRLTNLYTTRPDGAGHQAFSYPDFVDLRAATTDIFDGVAGYSGLLATWSVDGRAESLFGEIVTGSYFETLGVRPALGRLLGPDDDRVPGQHPVVVVGHGFWRSRLGADPGVVGRPIVLNGRPYVVVGVAPSSFTGSLFRGFAVDVWAPSMMMGQLRTDHLSNRAERWMFARARLRPGVDVSEAAAALAVVGARLDAEYPSSNAGRRFLAVRTDSVWFSPDADGPLKAASVLLVGVCLLVLAVGTSNVLGLIAARLVTRSRDFAVYAALGATTSRIFRQILAETWLVAAVGGGLGVLGAAIGARALSSYRPPLPVPLAFDVRVDWRVALFALGLTTVVAGLMAFGCVRQLRRRETIGALRQSFAGSAVAMRSRRHWLLAPQVAGSVILLVLALVASRSVKNATTLPPGFDIAPVGMLTFNTATSGLDEAVARRFFDAVVASTAATPGVTAVAVADRVPLDLYGNRTVAVAAGAGRAAVGRQAASVTPGYFEVLGIPIVAGRAFTDADLLAAPTSAVVNEAFASVEWPGEAAIGRDLTVGGRTVTVVGVAGNAKVSSLAEAATPMVYLPLSSGYAGLLRVVVRAEPAAVGTALDAALSAARQAAPGVALFERRTMAESVGLLLLPYEIGARLGTWLGLGAMALAAVGLHGLVAFAVAARRREFGVRLALGASTWQVIVAATSDVARATMAGIVIGLGVAAIGAGALSSVLVGVPAVDVPAFTLAAALTLGIAIVAAAAPASRLRGSSGFLHRFGL